MVESSFSSPVAVELRFDDLLIRIRFELPPQWSRQTAHTSHTTAALDAEGRLSVRFTAVRDNLRLQVSASRAKLPMGLAPAVVYWLGLYGLDGLPDGEADWTDCAAMSGWFESQAEPNVRVALAWLQIENAVVEIRLQGSPLDEPAMRAIWLHLQAKLRCESTGDPEVAADEPQPWWAKVRTLRERGQLDDALALAEKTHDAEALLVQADIHAERMKRALAAHQRQSARTAWQRAADCARAYAASATSGGEGAARSIERDRVLSDLGPEPL